MASGQDVARLISMLRAVLQAMHNRGAGSVIFRELHIQRQVNRNAIFGVVVVILQK
jgi:hypothetical protein